MLATINPAGLPALRIAGGLFLIINLLAAAYLFQNWRRFFGPDATVYWDVPAARQLRVLVIFIPLGILTFRIFVEWVGFFTS